MAKQDELAIALRDLLREVRKINDVLLPDGFDARAVRNAEIALAAYSVSASGPIPYLRKPMMEVSMADRDQYLLRSLVTAQRERKMAMKTRDEGLIKSAETRLAVAWKNACDHVDDATRSAMVDALLPSRDGGPHA